MGPTTALAKKPPAKRTTKKLAYATPKTAKSVKGRRAFFQYRDLGVSEATDGVMRAQLIIGSKGMTKPTGWHYHLCEAQFVYGVKGWVDLEFEDGSKIRLKQGESLMIPGGMRHNETATSEELELLEVSVPADMGTVPCDAPSK